MIRFIICDRRYHLEHCVKEELTQSVHQNNCQLTCSESHLPEMNPKRGRRVGKICSAKRMEIEINKALCSILLVKNENDSYAE